MLTHSVAIQTQATRQILRYKRLLLPIMLACLLINTDSRDVTLAVLSDAFWQVAVFVALTLAFYQYLSLKVIRWVPLDQSLSEKAKITAASVMGCLPGCGGAIVVITQFVQGKTSFAAVVSVLIATMGDAAFLLIAREPLTGLQVTVASFMVAVLSGLVVNKIHRPDFLQVEPKPVNKAHTHKPTPSKLLRLQGLFWRVILAPTAVVSLLIAFQFEVNHLLGLQQGAIELIGALLAMVTVLLWAMTRDVCNYETLVSEDPKTTKKLFQKVALDTQFVVSWVVVAFLIFELTMLYSGIDLAQMISGWGAFTPLFAILLGMLPGCGPQILVTSMYLSGTLPLSAQLGNAISNDGDALFPAIVLAPKAALLATLYSTVPAFLLAYGYYFIFE
ncbi:putative manganese transporter [Catenovulum sp. SM1970]|uniref:putative manganese transporter n=1 Tax=Marinifaba aquimaris TaxID=2741323 RepID=UPI001573C690|nr:putative manganese transporter [Marinifaba aquimaris]NTS77266.1 putative manganese transporter [Marinifaba aquimaris]